MIKMDNNFCSKDHINDYIKTRKESIKVLLNTWSYIPTIAIIQVGYVEASERYIRGKIRDCDEVGIKTFLFRFEEDISYINFAKEVEKISNMDHINGIIIQKPLPYKLEMMWDRIINIIPARKDIDGFRRDSLFRPCTPKGIMDYMAYSKYIVQGKHCVIMGRSDLVGKPLADMMLDADATVTICHSKTKNIERIARTADILISAIGKPKIIGKKFVKPNSVVIDVGINFDNMGKMCGDINYDEVIKITNFCTPVPGGVGLLTRIALIDNALRSVT